MHWRLLKIALPAIALVVIASAGAATVIPTSQLQSVQPLSSVARLDLPPVDIAAAKAEDAGAKDAPPRFALAEKVDITPDNAGTWESLPDPDTLLWRLHVTAPNALSLNLGFDRFWLPKSTRLVVYPVDGDMTTARVFNEFDNRDGGQMWTPVVLGSDIVIELTLPAEFRHNFALHIASINKGYRVFGEQPSEKSGACNIDVVCPEGDDWRGEINANGVYTVNGTWYCSGSMVNNTADDGTPYFLTAYHCGVTSSNAGGVVIYWNFQSPTCGQHGGGSLADYSSGTIFRARYSTSDFCLLELQQAPDPAWNVTFNGWDRTSNDPTSAVAIHHPNCDEKSISFEYDPTSTTSYLGTSSPGDGTHIRITDWDLGTTEPGSSGSPLYDQNHHLVGQLHGGYAACGNDLSDYYGRFSLSWTGGGSATSRLSDWLDPIGTAPSSIDLYDPNATGMAVTPFAALDSQGNHGGPFTPSSKTYSVINQGDAAFTFAVTVDQPWVSISGGSGSLTPGNSADVVVSLNGAANALPNGTYTASVSFVNQTNGDGDTTRAAHLQVGVPEVVYSFPLDSDPGWTTEGQWAWGHPTGGNGDHGSPDPTNGYTGSYVMGYNLTGGYTNDLPEYSVTTGAIDCSQLQAVSVRFRRWLGVEQPAYDHAYVRVSNDGSNWTTVWENGAEISDTAWQLVEYDISAIADGHATVYLRWTMGTTDGSWTFCGWNLDDVEILGLQPQGQTPVEDTPALATALRGAAPNPFNPKTDVHFDVARAGHTTLAIFDARGQRVRVLVDAELPAGSHTVPWDGTDAQGRRVGSGVYFLRLAAGDVHDVSKVVMVK